MNVLSSRRLRDNCWLLLMPFDIIMKHWVSWEEGKLRLPIRPVTKGAKMVLIRTQCFWSIIYDLFLFMTNHLPFLALIVKNLSNFFLTCCVGCFSPKPNSRYTQYKRSYVQNKILYASIVTWVCLAGRVGIRISLLTRASLDLRESLFIVNQNLLCSSDL